MNLRKRPRSSAARQPLEELTTVIPTNSIVGSWIQQRKRAKQDPTTRDKSSIKVKLRVNRTLNKTTLVAMNLKQEQLSTISNESTLTLLLQEAKTDTVKDIPSSSARSDQLDPITQPLHRDDPKREQENDVEKTTPPVQATKGNQRFESDITRCGTHASDKPFSLSALVDTNSPTSNNKAVTSLSTSKNSRVKPSKKDTLVNHTIRACGNFEVISHRDDERKIQFDSQPYQNIEIYDEVTNKNHQAPAPTCEQSFTQDVGFTQIITQQQQLQQHGFTYTQTQLSQSQETIDISIQSTQAEICTEVEVPRCAIQTQPISDRNDSFRTINVSIGSNLATLDDNLITQKYHQPIHVGSTPAECFTDVVHAISSQKEESLNKLDDQLFFCTPGRSAKRNIQKVVCVSNEASIIHTRFCSDSEKEIDDTDGVKNQAYAHSTQSSAFHTVGPTSLISVSVEANSKPTDNTVGSDEDEKSPSELKTNIPDSGEASLAFELLHSPDVHQITNQPKSSPHISAPFVTSSSVSNVVVYTDAISKANKIMKNETDVRFADFQHAPTIPASSQVYFTTAGKGSKIMLSHDAMAIADDFWKCSKKEGYSAKPTINPFDGLVMDCSTASGFKMKLQLSDAKIQAKPPIQCAKDGSLTSSTSELSASEQLPQSSVHSFSHAGKRRNIVVSRDYSASESDSKPNEVDTVTSNLLEPTENRIDDKPFHSTPIAAPRCGIHVYHPEVENIRSKTPSLDSPEKRRRTNLRDQATPTTSPRFQLQRSPSIGEATTKRNVSFVTAGKGLKLSVSVDAIENARKVISDKDHSALLEPRHCSRRGVSSCFTLEQKKLNIDCSQMMNKVIVLPENERRDFSRKPWSGASLPTPVAFSTAGKGISLTVSKEAYAKASVIFDDEILENRPSHKLLRGNVTLAGKCHVSTAVAEHTRHLQISEEHKGNMTSKVVSGDTNASYVSFSTSSNERTLNSSEGVRSKENTCQSVNSATFGPKLCELDDVHSTPSVTLSFAGNASNIYESAENVSIDTLLRNHRISKLDQLAFESEVPSLFLSTSQYSLASSLEHSTDSVEIKAPVHMNTLSPIGDEIIMENNDLPTNSRRQPNARPSVNTDGKDLNLDVSDPLVPASKISNADVLQSSNISTGTSVFTNVTNDVKLRTAAAVPCHAIISTRIKKHDTGFANPLAPPSPKTPSFFSASFVTAGKGTILEVSTDAISTATNILAEVDSTKMSSGVTMTKITVVKSEMHLTSSSAKERLQVAEEFMIKENGTPYDKIRAGICGDANDKETHSSQSTFLQNVSIQSSQEYGDPIHGFKVGVEYNTMQSLLQTPQSLPVRVESMTQGTERSISSQNSLVRFDEGEEYVKQRSRPSDGPQYDRRQISLGLNNFRPEQVTIQYADTPKGTTFKASSIVTRSTNMKNPYQRKRMCETHDEVPIHLGSPVAIHFNEYEDIEEHTKVHITGKSPGVKENLTDHSHKELVARGLESSRSNLYESLAGIHRFPSKVWTESVNDCIKDGVNPVIVEVDAMNASKLRFEAGSGSPCAFLGRPDPSGNRSMGGSKDLRDALVTLGCDSKSFTDKWIENHSRWIVWKLASIERRFSSSVAGEYCTFSRLVSKLKSRHEKEIEGGQRSSIRKLLNRDVSSSRMMILCVSYVLPLSTPRKQGEDANSNSSNNIQAPTVRKIELTDGWYGVQAELDPTLGHFVENGRIAVGTKLMVSNAVLKGSPDGIDPLDDTYSSTKSNCVAGLCLSANSTRLAKWYAKLGFVPPTKTQRENRGVFLVKSLSNVIIGGGNLPLIDLMVSRIYPRLYLEKTGKPANSSSRPPVLSVSEEHVRKNEFMKKRQKAIDSMSGSIQRECAREVDEMAPDLWKSLVKSDCHGSFYDHLSKADKACIDQWKERRTCILYEKVRKELESQLENDESMFRESTPFIRVLVTSFSPTTEICGGAILTLWNYNEDQLALFKEGNVVRVHNLSVRGSKHEGMLQLTAGSRTLIEQSPRSSERIVLGYQPRCFTKIVLMHAMSLKLANRIHTASSYPEVDTVGVVLKVVVEEHHYSIYLTDESGLVLRVDREGTLSDTDPLNSLLPNAEQNTEFPLIMTYRDLRILPFNQLDACAMAFYTSSSSNCTKPSPRVSRLQSWAKYSSLLLRTSAYLDVCLPIVLRNEDSYVFAVGYIMGFQPQKGGDKIKVQVDCHGQLDLQVWDLPFFLFHDTITLVHGASNHISLDPGEEGKFANLKVLGKLLGGRGILLTFGLQRVGNIYEVRQIKATNVHALANVYQLLNEAKV